MKNSKNIGVGLTTNRHNSSRANLDLTPVTDLLPGETVPAPEFPDYGNNQRPPQQQEPQQPQTSNNSTMTFIKGVSVGFLISKLLKG